MSLIFSNKTRDWKHVLETQKKSGISSHRWCHQNHVPYTTFMYWKRRFTQTATLSRESFTELLAPTSKSGIQLECNGVRVLLDKDFDSSTLMKCLQTLKRTPC
jgi:nitrate/TMAO reductase-like tetraheme cytochrome c subunit